MLIDLIKLIGFAWRCGGKVLISQTQLWAKAKRWKWLILVLNFSLRQEIWWTSERIVKKAFFCLEGQLQFMFPRLEFQCSHESKHCEKKYEGIHCRRETYFFSQWNMNLAIPWMFVSFSLLTVNFRGHGAFICHTLSTKRMSRSVKVLFNHR